MVTTCHFQMLHQTPMHRSASLPMESHHAALESRLYRLVAMIMPAADGNPERVFLALQRHRPILDYLLARMREEQQFVRSTAELEMDARQLSHHAGLSHEHVRRMLPIDVRQPHTLLRPFVLRAVRGERIELHITNCTQGLMQLALLDDDYGIACATACQSPLAVNESGVYYWHCNQTGIYPIFNQACTKRSHHRCLLGVLMIEP